MQRTYITYSLKYGKCINAKLRAWVIVAPRHFWCVKLFAVRAENEDFLAFTFHLQDVTARDRSPAPDGGRRYSFNR